MLKEPAQNLKHGLSQYNDKKNWFFEICQEKVSFGVKSVPGVVTAVYIKLTYYTT